MDTVKGYKVFDENWECHGFQYEVGKTYILEGDLEMCKNGFHFCRKPEDCFGYKAFNPKNKCAEVEAVGAVIEGRDKCVTDKIRIVREIPWTEMLMLCNSGLGNSGCKNSGNGNSGDQNTGNWNSGHKNSGHGNSGNQNTGHQNTGNWNSGHHNSGHHNSGRYNSGNFNNGDFNSGDGNSGNQNSGCHNSGHSNRGDFNSGSFNSGSWNSGAYNSGFLNTTYPKVRIFDKETDVKLPDIVFPDFFRFILCEWIPSYHMTEKEMEENPLFEVTGGYLKVHDYKDAWRKSFLMAKSRFDWEDERDKLLALPNFDFDKFEQITGITKRDILED